MGFPTSSLVTMMVLTHSQCAIAFNSGLFQQAPELQRTTPSKTEGVDIELPDVDALFGRIQQVSPLARAVIQGEHRCQEKNNLKGFSAIDDKCKLFTCLL
jgi:hypothetical protein